MIEIQGRNCILRPWRAGDEPSLVRHANNRKIWRNLRDLFPHPYTSEDARRWIALCLDAPEPPTNLAIAVEGEAAGGIGLVRQTDVARHTAEVGYWLGESLWGRGIATEALKLMVEYAFNTFDLVRLEAGVFEWNPASARVLEKAGFNFECRHRKAVFKDGEFIDRFLFARVR